MTYKNPIPTVDIIIELGDQIVLIERRNDPQGWALPGGFVDYGESLEEAAVREAKEETGLDVHLVSQLRTYSDPTRDARKHTISTVFVATGTGTPSAADDAKSAGLFTRDTLPKPLCFDHARILEDYFANQVRAVATEATEPATASLTLVGLKQGYDYLASDGSEIRVLVSGGKGSLAHRVLRAGATTKVVQHHGVEELWYVLSGAGEVWRHCEGEPPRADRVGPGDSLCIPVGVSYQFRALSDADLKLLLTTMPPWPDEGEPTH